MTNTVENATWVGGWLGGELVLNGKRTNVYREPLYATTGKRVGHRYGVRVAPSFNQSGEEWVYSNSLQRLVKKLATDKRQLFAA